MKSKKGASEIISYFLLIAITIGVSIGVYAWLKYQIPSCSESNPDCFLPKDCNSDTSLVMDNYSCSKGGINITLINNGRFNISGVILSVSDTSGQIPDSYLEPIGSVTLPRASTKYGEFVFPIPFKPGAESTISFSPFSKSGGKLLKIEELKLQIFLFEGRGRTLCKNVLIRESIKNCNL